MRCACDACLEVSENRQQGAPWTPDGYCHYCDRFCFPWGSQNGMEPKRLRLSREARMEQHGHTAKPAGAIVEDHRPYLPREIANVLVASIPSTAVRSGVQVGMTLMDTLAPYIAPGAKKLFGEVTKRLPKPKKRKRKK